VAVAAGEGIAHAALSPTTVLSVARAATSFAGGKSSAGIISAPVLWLTRKARKNMLLTKVKSGMAIVCAGFFVAGVIGGGRSMLIARPSPPLAELGIVAGSSEEKPESPAPKGKNAAETPQARTTTTAAVAGVVKDSEDRPIPGATVLLRSQERPLIVQTGSDGSFAFVKFPVTIDNLYALRLVAGKAGYAPAIGWATTDDDARNKQKVLKLGRAATLSGSVRDTQGRAVAGAGVEFAVVERYGLGYAPIGVVRGTVLERFWFTRTDNNGRFQFSTVSAGKDHTFHAWADGFADLDTAACNPRRYYKAGPGATPVQLTLARGGRVDGRIVTRMPGVRVGGLHVWLDTPLNLTLDKQAWTDSDGQIPFRRSA
jgi:hypothetical protein